MITFQCEPTDTSPTTPIKSDEPEVLSANMCINEISNQLTQSLIEEKVEKTEPEPDSTFVTVIEVNGLKQANASPQKNPPE